MVEHLLGKEVVVGSIPIPGFIEAVRSKEVRMERRRLIYVAIVGALCCLGISSGRAEEDKEKPRLGVSVQESVTAVPDVAYIMSGVSTQAPLAEDAMSENQETVQKVLAALKKAGIPKESIRIMGAQLATASRRLSGEGEQRSGFKVFTRIVVKVASDEKKIASLVDKMTKAGANVFGGESSDFSSRRAKAVVYMLQDDSKPQEEAMKKAAAKLLPQAKKLAGSMGITLGEIQYLSSTREDRDRALGMADEQEEGLPQGPKSNNSKAIEIKAWLSAWYLIKK